ncbi:(2Fe-2S)-binding protein [Pseudohalioglobus sediminis]|uniref:(2Fe-2S)-binding protein n=1 Tax=Pseudohalioglobus sediminis TaxID=2606449 RepID=A0A5B0X077_9GAMM|nr:2Fe-2S iron-sulfur cluster-binding protein [Pseudohalioglobus sediminis]KAA1191977.1 (2Fe-2S)-binding protein [Pseudohalioglobus sediminis]
MTRIHVTDASGASHVVEAPNGESLMSALLNAGIDGILADCGGGCACATCHCYIEGDGMDRVGEANSLENLMLDSAAAERRDNSRLSCQIDVTEALEGLKVTVAENA